MMYDSRQDRPAGSNSESPGERSGGEKTRRYSATAIARPQRAGKWYHCFESSLEVV